MTTNTQINITAKDSTAGAFASASGNLTALSGRAIQTAAAFASIGLSVGGLAASIKHSIDAADETFKLSQKIGVAVEQIAGLQLAFKQSGLGADQLQSSISKLSKNVASGSKAFDALGIATRGADGNLKSTRDILAEVSNKFAGYQDGIAKTALAIELFGKSGADVIPFLNQGAESLAEFDAMAEKLGLTLSTSTAKKAEEFNDTLSLIGQSFKGVSTRIAAEMLPTLRGLAEQFFSTATQGNNVKVVADAITTTFKGLVAGGLAAAGAFKTIGTTLGGVAAMWGAIANGEFSQAATIVRQIKADFADNFKNTIDNVTNAWKANGSASVEALTATQKQVQIQAPLTSEVEKSTKAIEKQSKALNWQVGNLKELQDIYSRVQSITKGVETEQERYNSTLEELNRLKPYLGTETYARALEKAQKELKGTEVQTRQTTDEVSQLWMQAGRNIQSALANGIFNFFDDGLKGMVKSVASTVGRILSEFAALKLAQSIGLAGMFGAGAANAGNIAGSGSVFSSAANLGSSALNLFKFGGGISQGVSGFLGIGASGTQAAAQAGASALWGASGAASGGLSSLGSSFGAAAGPVMAAFAVDAIGRALAGDKKLGGAEMIPVLGGFLAAMFGHGPMKFRQQSLQGDISSNGFDGDITNVFRAKGGLFVGNKHKSITEQLSQDQQDLFDKTIKGFYTSAHGFAVNLGLSTELVDTFTKTIQIKSEKGKKLTEEAMTEMIQGIGNSLAENVIPGIEEFRIAGEKSYDTFARLSNQFSVLTSAASLLFDKSAEWGKNFVNQFGFGARNAFLEQAGGADAFAGMVSGFAQNFLTEDQRFKPVIESLVSERDKLGLSRINTRQQFTSAVQSGNLNPEQLLFLLKNQDSINQVFIYLDKFNEAVKETASVVQQAAIELNIRNADETEQGQRLNNSINETARAIAELEGIASQLAGTVNSINPLTTDQARAIVAKGDPFDPNLQNALSVLSTSDNADFSSKLELQRSNALNIGAINSLQNSVAANISAKEAQQSQFEFEKQMLQIALNNAAVMFKTLAEASRTADILDRVTAGGGAMLVENV